jgi:hypothetical protein
MAVRFRTWIVYRWFGMTSQWTRPSAPVVCSRFSDRPTLLTGSIRTTTPESGAFRTCPTTTTASVATASAMEAVPVTGAAGGVGAVGESPQPVASRQTTQRTAASVCRIIMALHLRWRSSAIPFQKVIDGAANQFRHRKTGLAGQLAQGFKLLIGQVVVHALHVPIIHTMTTKARAMFRTSLMAKLAACLLAVAALSGQEIAVPTTPVVTTITSYRVTGFSFEREPDWRFVITFQDSNGKVYTDEHYGPTSVANPAGGNPLTNPNGADTFLKQLNTANLSTTSLTKRLLQHLVQHGKIPAATVTGTPEGGL